MPVILNDTLSWPEVLGGTPSVGRASARYIEIGIVNNMPDRALQATERQFLKLLEESASGLPIRITFFAFPDIPRSAAAQSHIDASYTDFAAIDRSALDALIVTGNEPRAASLADEPYWDSLVGLVRWAERHTISTIWSCLAAHAAVQALDGITRQPLASKRSGVFACAKISDQPLVAGDASPLLIAHSRYNDLRESELVSCGYELLTISPEAGVDTFVRRSDSLFVFFQGHPEYRAHTLWHEYRRDVGRFLRGESPIYPAVPANYFDPQAEDVLLAFAERARAMRHSDMLAYLPDPAPKAEITERCRTSASALFGSWLNHVAAQKHRRVTSAA
ncbi:MAG: homoserine O-succinyltransferase [Beijerinckiaceae bacterium]